MDKIDQDIHEVISCFIKTGNIPRLKNGAQPVGFSRRERPMVYNSLCGLHKFIELWDNYNREVVLIRVKTDKKDIFIQNIGGHSRGSGSIDFWAKHVGISVIKTPNANIEDYPNFVSSNIKLIITCLRKLEQSNLSCRVKTTSYNRVFSAITRILRSSELIEEYFTQVNMAGVYKELVDLNNTADHKGILKSALEKSYVEDKEKLFAIILTKQFV